MKLERGQGPTPNMNSKSILVVESHGVDSSLALRALRASGVAGDVIVVRDSAEALEYLFGTGTYAGRDLRAMPACLLLELELPQLDGLEVLRRVRADPRTRLIPIVVLAASCEPQD